MEEQELDTSWFDLKKYDKLNELNLDQWIKLFEFRGLFSVRKTLDSFEIFKRTPVNDIFIEIANKLDTSETFSVRNATVIDIGIIQRSEKLDNALQIFDGLEDSRFNKLLRQLMWLH